MSRRRYKRKSITEELLDALYELTGYAWQVGAVITALLLFLTYLVYDWVDHLSTLGGRSPALTALFSSFGWAVYLLPLILLVVAVLFGLKTLDTYEKGRF
jgi:hypothetical protein